MRTISKKTQYCLRALYALTRHYGHGPTLISRLSEEEAIPLQFLEQILLQLKRSGIVESKKGKGGGYRLVKPPDEVTIGSVIRLVEGPLAPLPCASDTAFRKCDECEDVRTCGTRFVMRQVRDATATILDKMTLTQVCDYIAAAKEASGEEQPQELMYYI
jgi:Rrf2 family protein